MECGPESRERRLHIQQYHCWSKACTFGRSCVTINLSGVEFPVHWSFWLLTYADRDASPQLPQDLEETLQVAGFHQLNELSPCLYSYQEVASSNLTLTNLLLFSTCLQFLRTKAAQTTGLPWNSSLLCQSSSITAPFSAQLVTFLLVSIIPFDALLFCIIILLCTTLFISF